MEEYFPADRLLELEIGSVVNIHSENQDLHFTVTLVGVDNGRFVVTTLPLKQNLSEGVVYESIFLEGNMFEMKTIHDGKVVAFESSVIGMYGNRLLISSFPEMIESRRLRRDTRFPCALSCDIRSGEHETYGVISNISHGGCQFNVEKNSDYVFVEESMVSGTPVELEIFFPTVENPVLLSAEVKSAVCQIDGACKVGLAFATEYEYVRKYLESLQLDSVAPFFN